MNARAKDSALGKALSAVLTLVFIGAVLVLPPVANEQLASAERTLQKPIVAVVIAITALALTAWKLRFAIGIVAVVFLVALVQVTYYFVTTEPGRAVIRAAAAWNDVPLASGAKGVAENTPDVFGRARLNWAGDQIRLDLRSETGTTQQGFNLNGGPVTSHFLFSARVEKIDGGRVVTCPLLFGIKDIRNYFTFRLQDEPDGSTIAIAYQIVAKSPSFTSGFYGILLDETKDLPYVNTWNLITPSERTKTTLAIEANGNYYRFFVNNREVFARQIDEIPTHKMAVGVTVLANGLKSDAVCQTDQVKLKVAS